MAKTKIKSRNIGMDVELPANACKDINCPFHGNIVIKKKLLTGKVVSAKMNKSAVIERELIRYLPKYERYSKRVSRISVHNPPCIAAKEGDVVRVALTRPLSKTKNHVIIAKVNTK